MRIQISLVEVYNFLKKYRRWILGAVFALLIGLNLFVYYQYVYLTTRAEPEPEIIRVVIDQEALEKVLNNLESREDNLSRTKKTQYPDPFR